MTRAGVAWVVEKECVHIYTYVDAYIQCYGLGPAHKLWPWLLPGTHRWERALGHRARCPALIQAALCGDAHGRQGTGAWRTPTCGSVLGHVMPPPARATSARAPWDMLLRSQHCIALQFPYVFCFWNCRFLFSVQLHHQLKSCSFCQKASSTACSLLSYSEILNTTALYKFLPFSQYLLFSPPEIRATWR